MKNFFEPKTIAIIGASEDPKKVGNSLMKNLSNFKGKIVPINIKRKEVLGIKAYPSVNNYKGKIDLAIIAIPAQFVASILEECGKKKIKDVVVISAGFSEVGNVAEEKKIIKVAKKHKIDLLGPNCFGVCNPHKNLDTTFALETPGKGSIAFVSQSGALWSYVADFSLGKFGFSGFVSLGNMAGVDFSDFIDYFRKDKKTKAIILYVEKLREGKRFIEVCKKCKKPMFVIKAGISEKGREAAISHTGSLATDFEIYKGAFKQSSVILCDSLISCFEKTIKKKLVKKRKKIKVGKKAVIITNAGGAGALMADYCFQKNIEVVDWPGNKNPLDIIGTALAEDYKKALNRLKGKKKNFYDTVLILLTPQKMSEIDKTAEEIINFSKQTSKKIIACFLGGESVVDVRKKLWQNNIPCVSTLKEARQIL